MLTKDPLLAASSYGDKSLPTLVLLHGFLGNKDDWQILTVLLQSQFHCLCIDLPGHGDSADIGLPIPGFESCAKHILRYLAHHSIQQFHLIGYSLGGRVALHIAQQAPQKLLSLQLESCHPGLLFAADVKMRLSNDRLWAEKLASLPIKTFLELWYQQGVFQDLTNKQRIKLIQQRSNNNSQALTNCYQATSLALQDNLWAIPHLLHQYQVHCQFYVGVNDKKFTELANKWQKTSGISVIVIADAGHNVHLANPKALADNLMQSLSMSFAKDTHQ